MIDQAEQQQRRLDELERRLRMVEGNQRTGVPSIRNAWMTAGSTQLIFGVTDTSGPVGATWEDDLGATGTGWPRLSVTSGSRVLIQWNARPIGLANSASHRSLSVNVGLLINGLSVTPTLPPASRQFANGNANPVDTPMSCAVIRTVPAGTNLYQIAAVFGNDVPAAPNQPTLTDVQLMITPLGFA